MKCPHCQSENREIAEFCGDCGQALHTPVPCPKCGNVNPMGKKFCDINVVSHLLVRKLRLYRLQLNNQSNPSLPPSPMAVTRSRSSWARAARRRSILPMILSWIEMWPLLSSRRRSWMRPLSPGSAEKPGPWPSWATIPIS